MKPEAIRKRATAHMFAATAAPTMGVRIEHEQLHTFYHRLAIAITTQDMPNANVQSK